MKNFKRSEFECGCGCGFSIVDFELVAVMDDIREHFNKPITITSGCRCAKHNSSIDGALKSKHILGIACDFKIKDINPDNVADYLENKYPNQYGIGRYIGRTHIDIRVNKARWDKR